MPDITLSWSYSLTCLIVSVARYHGHFEGEGIRKGSNLQSHTVASSRQEWNPVFFPHPSPLCSSPSRSRGRGTSGFCSFGTPKLLALVATLLVSLLQSDPLGLNVTPLPQDSSLVETPPAENKPRKRQLSEEQPSGNGVKKPKVSV